MILAIAEAEKNTKSAAWCSKSVKVVIAGGSGFIGRAVSDDLAQAGYQVVVLSRFRPGKRAAIAKVELRSWNPQSREHGDWENVLEGAEGVINLAGENIADKRWTANRKEEIINSRLVTTRSLVEAMGRRRNKPRVFISASAVGYYGPHGDGVLDESIGRGYGFLAQLCQKWEEEALKAERLGIRTVRLRIGIVLAREGGALKKMWLPFKLGLGGPIGDGDQWMSWISMKDVGGLIEFILQRGNCHGVINATAPHPVRNRDFASILGQALHRPAFFKVPVFVLNMLLGEMADMLVTGQRVMPRAALDAGYHFKYPTLSPALRALI